MRRSSAAIGTRARSSTRIRRGTAADAAALYELIAEHQVEGHLLPRDLDDLRRRASRFVVGESDGELVACAELAPLSPHVAEIRSLVVQALHRGTGIGGRMFAELRRRAIAEGFGTLSAFTHDPRFFMRQNFSMVPHQWVAEKIARDCVACPLFRRCGQHAMVLPLEETVRYGSNVVERRAAVA